jgi:hypothetical protein
MPSPTATLCSKPQNLYFLSLAPFTKYRDELADRGIHNAGQLKAAADHVLKELGLTDGELAAGETLSACSSS